MELSDIIISSKTQSSETIQKILDGAGYDNVATERLTDQPDDEPEQAEEPAAVEETPADDAQESAPVEQKDLSVPSPEPGVSAAAEDEGETEAESEPAEPQKQQDTPKGGFKKKLARAQTERDRFKSEVEELKRQLADRSAEKPKSEPHEAPVEPAKVEPAAKPKWEDFLDADDQLVAFNEALMDWKIEERERIKAEKEASERQANADNEAQAAAAAQREEIAKSWNAKLEAVREKYDDFDDLLANPDAKASAVMAQEFRDRDDGAELVYWLATNPGESTRIHNLTDVQAADSQDVVRRKMRIATRELDKISALIAQASDENNPKIPPVVKTAEAVPATTATKEQDHQATPVVAKKKPAPPSPVGNRGAATTRKLTELSAEELRSVDPNDWRRAREAEGSY